MEQAKIDRINALARKSRTPEGLTEAERAEQAQLRQEYILSFRRSLENELANTYVIDERGNKTHLKKKPQGR